METRKEAAPSAAQRARDDVRRAQRRGGYLPPGHPYSKLPTWVPYPLAKFIMDMVTPLDSTSSRKRKRRTSPRD